MQLWSKKYIMHHIVNYKEGLDLILSTLPWLQGMFPDPLPTEGLIMNRMAVLHQNWGASMQLDNFTI